MSAAEGGCGRHVRMMSTEWHMCENGCAKRAGMGMSSMVCQRLRGEVTVRNGEEAEVEYLHMQREHRHNRPRSTGRLPPLPGNMGPSPWSVPGPAPVNHPHLVRYKDHATCHRRAVEREQRLGHEHLLVRLQSLHSKEGLNLHDQHGVLRRHPIPFIAVEGR